MVLTNNDYANIAETPYVCPAHSGPLIIPALTSQHPGNRIREDHRALIRVFHEVTNLQKAITKQILKAIYPVYIKTLRDRSTNIIQVDVPTVLGYLFTIYGTIEPEVLMECELKVREMAYDLMHPLISIYDEIEELEYLGVNVFNPYPMSQLVSYGITIIKNTNNFETGISRWIMRPVNDHTWTNFRTHFEGSHRVIRSVQGTTMQSAAYYHANSLASQLLSEVKSV